LRMAETGVVSMDDKILTSNGERGVFAGMRD
jgi:hypothetical protein